MVETYPCHYTGVCHLSILLLVKLEMKPELTIFGLELSFYEYPRVDSCQCACADQKVAEDLASDIIFVDIRLIQTRGRADICLWGRSS